jgi:divalent metal cation (Fe/Co/Zn/Cd) transporter
LRCVDGERFLSVYPWKVTERMAGSRPAIDMVIAIDPNLSTTDAHEIADPIENLLEERFQARDISIHIEPYS